MAFSPAWETFLRVAGSALIVAILGVLANSANLAGIIPAEWVPLVGTLATAILSAIDAKASPSGTVGFGYIGVQR